MYRYIKTRLILFVLILGLVLRLVSLNQSFWLDEATTANIVSQFGFLEIITKFSPGDFHPPLYYLLVKVWSLFFGTSEVGLRSMSVLFGVATIYVVYLITKLIANNLEYSVHFMGRIWNLEFPLIAALLLATSGLHVYYSQEARMYAMAAFFVSLAVYSFLKTLDNSRSTDWVLFSASLGALTLTDYLAALVIPVFWISGYLAKKDASWWKAFLISHVPLIVVWLAWLPVFSEQLANGLAVKASLPLWWETLGKFSLKEILLVPIKFMLGRISFTNKILYGFVLVSSSCVFGYLIFRALRIIRAIRSLRLILLWLILPFALALALSLKLSVLSYFRLLFMLPAFYILLSFGLSTLKERPARMFLALILTINLVTSFSYLLYKKFQREDWRRLVSFIHKESEGKSAATVFVGKGQQEGYRYYARTINQVEPINPGELSDDYDTVWLMRYVQPIFDPKDETRKKVEELGYRKRSEYDFNNVIVWKYTK